MDLIGFREATTLEESLAEVEVKVGKLKNGKAAGKDEITGEMTKVEVTGWWIGFGGFVI